MNRRMLERIVDRGRTPSNPRFDYAYITLRNLNSANPAKVRLGESMMMGRGLRPSRRLMESRSILSEGLKVNLKDIGPAKYVEIVSKHGIYDYVSDHMSSEALVQTIYALAGASTPEELDRFDTTAVQAYINRRENGMLQIGGGANTKQAVDKTQCVKYVIDWSRKLTSDRMRECGMPKAVQKLVKGIPLYRVWYYESVAGNGMSYRSAEHSSPVRPGGWVEGYHNLSQSGSCTIEDNAIACGSTRIEGSDFIDGYTVCIDGNDVTDPQGNLL